MLWDADSTEPGSLWSPAAGGGDVHPYLCSGSQMNHMVSILGLSQGQARLYWPGHVQCSYTILPVGWASLLHLLLRCRLTLGWPGGCLDSPWESWEAQGKAVERPSQLSVLM